MYLEAAALDSATVALANATRESLRMADMVEGMLKNSLEAFRTQNREPASGVSAIQTVPIRQLGSAIRGYLVAIGSEQTLDDAREGARLQDILSAVINVEHVSDIVANSLMESAVKQQKRGQTLSADELEAIAMMHSEAVRKPATGHGHFFYVRTRPMRSASCSARHGCVSWRRAPPHCACVGCGTRPWRAAPWAPKAFPAHPMRAGCSEWCVATYKAFIRTWRVLPTPGS